MKTFDIDITINVKDSPGSGMGGFYYDTINAKGVPAKLVFALLTWIFKLTEGYDKDPNAR